MSIYECTVCAPGDYTTDNRNHMKSHLGSKKDNHNMGPFLCGFQGCDERAVRGENNVRHATPVDHQAQFARDATLASHLNDVVARCLRPATTLPLGAPPPPAPAGPSTGPSTDPTVNGPVSVTPADTAHSTHHPIPLKYEVIVDPASAPNVSPEQAYQHGAPVRRYLNEHIVPPLLAGLRLLKDHEPNKPLKALGEYFLTGHDNISGCERVPFHRESVAVIVMEASKYVAMFMPENPKKWYGNYLLARSAELEED